MNFQLRQSHAHQVMNTKGPLYILPDDTSILVSHTLISCGQTEWESYRNIKEDKLHHIVIIIIVIIINRIHHFNGTRPA